MRLKLGVLAVVLAVLTLGVLAVALENDAVSKLFDQRASTSQSYDEGPQGRFGGQQKALSYAQDNPLDWGVAADKKREDLIRHAPEGATLKAKKETPVEGER